MLVALVEIASVLGCRSYVPKKFQRIKVKDKPLAENQNVVTDLGGEGLISNFPEAAKAGSLIDCIWFKNAQYMPAVFEVEYTTGVTSGLSRMLNFQDKFIPIATRYILAAPDDERNKVMRELSKNQFQKMAPAFLPFSAIHELYSWAQKGRLKGLPPDVVLGNFVETA